MTVDNITSTLSPPVEGISAEEGLARFVINGSGVPEGINKSSVRSVLSDLAGREELEDPYVQDRFGRLNRYLTDDPTLILATPESPDSSFLSADGTKSGERDEYTKIKEEAQGFKPGNGACIGVDPELFFPKRGEPLKEAKAVCEACEVRLECLEYALKNNERAGIWGGLSAVERRSLNKERKAAAKDGKDAVNSAA